MQTLEFVCPNCGEKMSLNVIVGSAAEVSGQCWRHGKPVNMVLQEVVDDRTQDEPRL